MDFLQSVEQSSSTFECQGTSVMPLLGRFRDIIHFAPRAYFDWCISPSVCIWKWILHFE